MKEREREREGDGMGVRVRGRARESLSGEEVLRKARDDQQEIRGFLLWCTVCS